MPTELRPFRFATGGGTADRARLVENARAAESMGYSTYLIADHLQDQAGPVPALATVAAVTSRLRIGTIVFNNDLRHPAVLAQDLATLDLLSEGRLEIGLGAGWNVDEYTRAGLSFDKHAVRFERMRESMAVLKGLLGEGTFSFAGRHYQIHEMDGLPKPWQRPHPPFLIGGGGRKMLEFAAREAQIVGLAPRLPTPAEPDIASCTAAATEEKVAWIRAAAGPRLPTLELNTYSALGPAQVTDDALAVCRKISERLQEHYGRTLTVDELMESPHVFVGTIDQLVDKCLMLRQRFGISYIYCFGDPATFAPVVERLAS